MSGTVCSHGRFSALKFFSSFLLCFSSTSLLTLSEPSSGAAASPATSTLNKRDRGHQIILTLLKETTPFPIDALEVILFYSIFPPTSLFNLSQELMLLVFNSEFVWGTKKNFADLTSLEEKTLMANFFNHKLAKQHFPFLSEKNVDHYQGALCILHRILIRRSVFLASLSHGYFPQFL